MSFILTVTAEFLLNLALLVVFVAVNLVHWLNMSKTIGYEGRLGLETFWANLISLLVVIAALGLGPARQAFPFFLGLSCLFCAREALFLIYVIGYAPSFARSMAIAISTSAAVIWWLWTVRIPADPEPYFWFECLVIATIIGITYSALKRKFLGYQMGTT